MASNDCFSDFRSYPPLEPLDPFDPFKPLNPGRRRPMPKRPFEVYRKATSKETVWDGKKKEE